MIVIHVVMAVLAAWRLTELITQDRVTEFIRRRKDVHYFWTCSRCVSVWCGIAATAFFVFFPWLNWPFALSLLFSIYGIALQLLNAKLQEKQRRITIFPDQGRVDRGPFDEVFTINILRSSATVIEQVANGRRAVR